MLGTPLSCGVQRGIVSARTALWTQIGHSVLLAEGRSYRRLQAFLTSYVY